MAIASPIISYPGAGPEIRSNSVDTSISGTTVANTTAILYQYAVLDEGDASPPTYSGYMTEGVSFVPNSYPYLTDIPWSLDTRVIPEFVVGKVLYVLVYAEDSAGPDTSLPTPYVIHLVAFTGVPQLAPTPTGLNVRRSNTAVTVEVSEMMEGTYAGTFVGYNFYVSLDQGGGISGYQRANLDYVKTPARIVPEELTSSTSTVISGNVTVETKIASVEQVPRYAYVLDKNALQDLISRGKLPSVKYSDATTFYFVATTVVFDEDNAVEVESSYSPEISVRFLTFTPEFKELPPRNRDDVVLAIANRLLALNKQANVVSGSVYRDIIDPVSEELANYYIVQDFISRSQSVDGLLRFDDADGDGLSDPVDSSLEKKRLQAALGVPNALVVQSIIDSAFSKLGANFNVYRLPPSYATGTVVFYTTSVPKEGLYINNGAVVSARAPSGDALKFVVQGERNLAYSERERFYNYVTKRYEIVCDVKAAVTGLSSNVAVGAINSILNGADFRWKVTNTVPTHGGSSTENNNSLANRTKLALAGLDTGTEGGYLSTALGIPGVRYAKVVKSGDPMMLRDLDPSTGNHLGGKVDVYIQGSTASQTQDTFAYSYSGPAGNGSGERFFVEDAGSYLIRTSAPAVTVATPIFEVLRVTNLTRGQDYDISGAVVGLGDGDSVMLAQNSTNLSIGMATLDVIEADYRYRGSNSFVLAHQPVGEILSVTGDIDGLLPKDNYKLIKLEDPLYTGESSLSSDGVELVHLRGLPTDSVSVTNNEPHTLIPGKPATLSKKGVDTDTIIVSADTAQTDVFDRDVDYRVIRGGDQGDTQILLSTASRIRSGTTVYVSFAASQNFTVVYTYDKMVEDVQAKLDKTKHAAADVAVKRSVGNDVKISIRVTRKSGFSEATVANSIVNGLAAVIQNLKIGTGFYLDDMVNIVKNTEGVKTVHLPPYCMMKANGSFIANDVVGFADFGVYSQNTGMGVTSYVTIDPVLSYGTSEGGGPANLFRSIYENDQPLVMVSSPSLVSEAAGRGYIRGDGRIVVSTKDGMPPQTKEYKAAYYTYVSPSNEFAADIEVGSMEYLTIGASSITVDASVEESVNRSA